MELIGNLPPLRLVKQKLITMSDIVHSQLFLSADCRSILLPSILAKIKELIESSEEVCVFFITVFIAFHMKKCMQVFFSNQSLIFLISH